MNSYLLNQYQHMHWANQKLITTLGQADVALPGAVELMSHIVSAEHLWLARATSQAEVLAPWSVLTLPECAEYAAANAAGYLELIQQLDEARLQEVIAFKLTNGTPMTSALGDILCHVPVHGSHHRGQITRIIAQHGLTPPSIDYIVYSMQRE